MQQDSGEIKEMKEWEKLMQPMSAEEAMSLRNKLIPFEVGEVLKIKECYFKIHCFRKDINGLVLQGISKEEGQKILEI